MDVRWNAFKMTKCSEDQFTWGLSEKLVYGNKNVPSQKEQGNLV